MNPRESWIRNSSKKIHKSESNTVNITWNNDSQKYQGERRNHRLKYESGCLLKGISIKIWFVEGFARDCLLWVFVIHTQSNQEILSRTSFQSCCVSHMKITNVHVGTIHRNVRISLQFPYQFAIFISVWKFHISLQFSHHDSRTSFVRGFKWIPM